MIKFRNHKNEELLALADVTFKHTVNGEKSLAGSIYTNNDVLHQIDRGWSLEFENERYYVTYAKPNDLGNNITVEFDAVHEFFFKMGKSSVYTELSDGSHEASVYLDLIFKDSGYTYQNTVTIAAFEKQSFGMNTRLSLFNDFINQTGTEFSVSSKTVTITDKNGSDLSTIVRKGFNLQELGLEYNIGDFVTYAKGFGAYTDDDDHSKGRLTVEYTSPLASVYGKLEAAPFADERYTVKENLLNKITSLVDNSFSISVALTVEDLQRAGYEYALPTPGDYILAVDELLGFSQKIRIVSVEVQYDVNGNKQQTQVTCSSLSAAEQNNEADAKTSDTMNDIINGDGVIPNSWLEDAIQIATNALINTQTQLKFTNNGILAIDKTNANNIVIFNAAGLGVSTDGGKTFANAITGNGINATSITTGILKAINIEGVTIKGSTIETADGNGFVIRLAGGNITFNANNTPIGGINDAMVNNKISGFDIHNLPGYSLTLSQSAGVGKASTTLLAIPADSTFNDPYIKHYGRFSGALRSRDNVQWIEAKQQVIISGNDGKGNQLNVYGNRVEVLGNFTVFNGSKNAAHVTRDGVRATPAYETAESYLGDIGESITDDKGLVTIPIDTLFSDIVNINIAYQVFITPYGSSRVWVDERQQDHFVVRSAEPNIGFGWEIKAKRRGYESERLVDQNMSFEEINDVFRKDNSQNENN